MKRIATFGCSYTAGHGPDLLKWVNWPTELSFLFNDNIEIYNCAKGGTSIDYSVHALESFLNYETPDLVLFQLSTPHRLTWISSDSDLSFEDMYSINQYSNSNIVSDSEVFKNYKSLNNYYKVDLISNWGFITPGSTSSPYSSNKLANAFYGTIGTNLIDKVKIKSLIHYIKTHLLKDIPHLLLTHDGYDLFNMIGNNSIDLDFKTALGTEYFDNQIIDNGRHLSHNALQEIAKILYNKVKKEGLIE